MCVFDSRGTGRWRKKLNGWMAMSGGRRRSSAGWVAKVSRGGEGGRVLVKGEINQLKAIGGKRLLQCH